MKLKDMTRGEAFGVRIGDFVENSIEKQIISKIIGRKMEGIRNEKMGMFRMWLRL